MPNAGNSPSLSLRASRRDAKQPCSPTAISWAELRREFRCRAARFLRRDRAGARTRRAMTCRAVIRPAVQPSSRPSCANLSHSLSSICNSCRISATALMRRSPWAQALLAPEGPPGWWNRLSHLTLSVRERITSPDLYGHGGCASAGLTPADHGLLSRSAAFLRIR